MSLFPFSKSQLAKQLYINNAYVKCKSSRTLTLSNPVDGSLVADDVALAGEQDVDAAVDAAEKAFPAWKKMTPSKRRDIMLKFASLVEEHGDRLAELTRVTLGAPYGAFGSFEIKLTAEVRFYWYILGRS